MGAEIFPLLGNVTNLDQTDFFLFNHWYQDIVKQLIPTSQQVRFISKQLLATPLPPDADQYLQTISMRSGQGKNRVWVDQGSLLLPLQEAGDEGSVAMVSGIDPIIVSKSAEEWLVRVEDKACQEFLQIRQLYTDSLTGMYNTQLLNDFLQSQEPADHWHLLVVELFGSYRTPWDSFNHIGQTVSYFQAFNLNKWPIFHLGNGVFAILVLGVKRGSLNTLCSSLINFFKNRKYRRAHCGFSSFLPVTHEHPGDTAADQTTVLQEALKALHFSCKRGPFAYGDYHLIANPGLSKLNPEPRATISRLRYRWKTLPSFNLILLKPAYRSAQEVKTEMAACLSGENVVFGRYGAYVIRTKEDLEASRRWTAEIVKSLSHGKTAALMVSGGVATYPFLKMSKSDTVLSCLKATIHASFLGLGSTVIFDEVSQNIAGDIYFEEGDFNRAIKQYRLGLDINPLDLNLLNSLGVSYALMNKKKMAYQSFDLVLNHEPTNIMALYNRALGLFIESKYQKALHFFARITPLIVEDNNASISLEELNYFIGICSFHTGDYNTSRQLLISSYDAGSASIEKGRCSRFIGVCYYHQNELESAAPWLQRALAHDKRDALSLSLLGDIYIRTGQGYAIGLRLLEKGLELAGDSSDFLLRYGQALNHGGNYRQAVEVLSRCVPSKTDRAATYLDLSLAHSHLKNFQKARFYLAKIPAMIETSGESAEKLRKIKKLLKQRG